MTQQGYLVIYNDNTDSPKAKVSCLVDILINPINTAKEIFDRIMYAINDATKIESSKIEILEIYKL